MCYRNCERSMYEIRWRTKEWLINSASGELLLVLAVIIIIAMVILIMAITIYWAFNVFNMALSSVFILFNIIIIKFLRGRVVPVLKIRKLKQREPINFKRYSFIHWIVECIAYLRSTHHERILSILQWTWHIPCSKFTGGITPGNKWCSLMKCRQGPVGALSRK